MIETKKFFDELSENFHKNLRVIESNKDEIIYERFKENWTQKIDSSFVYNEKEAKPYYQVYSPDDIKNIKDLNHKKIRQDMKTKLSEVSENTRLHFKNKPDEALPDNKLFFVISNEGVGKSTAMLNVVQPGDVIIAKTKDRLLELEKQYKESSGQHEIFKIFANSDIIGTVITNFRKKKEEDAQKIIYHYLNWCKQQSRYNKLKKIKQQLQEKNESTEDEKITLLAFLENNENIKEQEKIAIMEFYNIQQKFFISKKDQYIFMMTTKKFLVNTKTQPKAYKNLLVFEDEYDDDLYLRGTTYEKNNSELYHKLDMLATLKKNEDNKRYEKVWGYGSQNEYIIEFDNNKPLPWKQNNLKIIIFTTENIPQIIHSSLNEATIYDVRHHIYEDKLNIIGVQGLNARSNTFKNEGLQLKGRHRTSFIVEQIKRHLNVSDNMIIVDGIQHKQNTFNMQGSNQYLQRIKESEVPKNLAIVVKNLHPSQMIKYFPFLIEEYLRETTDNEMSFYEFISKSKYLEIIHELLINDIVNQAIGRVGGYRRQKELGKIYLIINMSLLNELSTFYVTPNIFKQTTFIQNKKLQNKFSKIHVFLDEVTFGLKQTEMNYIRMKIAYKHYVSKYIKTKSVDLEKKLIDIFGGIRKHWFVDLKKIGNYIHMIKKSLGKIKNLPPKNYRILKVGFIETFFSVVRNSFSKYIKNFKMNNLQQLKIYSPLLLKDLYMVTMPKTRDFLLDFNK